MKNLMAIVLLVTMTSMSFAQKNEIKAIEKALKSSNFEMAKTAIPAAEALIGSMDDKYKAKFYYLKAKALLADGAGADTDVDAAIESLTKLREVEASSGKLKYTTEANQMTSGMLNSFIIKGSEDFKNKDFKSASKRFERAYSMSPKDTLYLYYAASSAVSAKDYDTAIDYYTQLKDMNYTGIQMDYYATNVESGVEDVFGDKKTRDLSVKIKMHTNPRDEKSESNAAEIVKNIALIYVTQGKNEKAISAMADARAANPDDIGLLLSEADIHLKMGDRDKFKALMEEATQKDPNNAELFYNLGVISAQSGDQKVAKAYYEKAISLDPNYADAYSNLAVSILSNEVSLIEEMNNLGNSSVDNRKYDELKAMRTQIYKDAIPYLEKALSLKKANISAAETLMNIYSSLGETDKYKEMKAKVEEMEANAEGN